MATKGANSESENAPREQKTELVKSPTRKLEILLDVDDTLADTTGAQQQFLETKYPGFATFVDLRKRKCFDYSRTEEIVLANGQRVKIDDLVRDSLQTPGFFSHLPEIPGAVKIVKALLDRDDCEVTFVTAPLRDNFHAAGEKYHWLAQKFGEKVRKLIFVGPRKFKIRGDVLIDDRPQEHPEGTTWKQLYYPQAWNEDLTGVDRISRWSDTDVDAFVERVRRSLMMQ